MRQPLRRLATILAVLTVCAWPVVAQAAATEVTGSLSYADVDNAGTAWATGFNLDAPLNDHLQVGPALLATGVNPDDGESLYVTSFGGRVTLNLMGRDGLFVAASALYNTGNAEGYLLTPEIGFKAGGDGGFVRVSVAHPYHYSEGERIDLQRTEVVAAIGLRF